MSKIHSMNKIQVPNRWFQQLVPLGCKAERGSVEKRGLSSLEVKTGFRFRWGKGGEAGFL